MAYKMLFKNRVMFNLFNLFEREREMDRERESEQEREGTYAGSLSVCSQQLELAQAEARK